MRCPARIATRNNIVITKSKTHSHAPDPRELELKKAMIDFKDSIRHSNEPRRKIVQNFCSKVPVELSSQLPSMNSLMSTVHRERKANQDSTGVTRKNPKCLTDLVFNDVDIKTTSDEQFLIYDKHKIISGYRIIIFASPKALEFLANSSEWYMDGTFDVAPQLFKQLYTIHGK